MGNTLGRPSLLGASQRFPFFLGQQQRQGHSLLGEDHHGHHHEDHHGDHHGDHHDARALDGLYSAPPLPEAQPLDGLYSAPPVEIVPIDGLYGAPPPEPELPSYAEELPEPSAPVTEAVAPAPAMMMMDPSYNFDFSNEDSSRSEINDINNELTGSYSYLTPGGEEINVRYRAGADTGFVIENIDEVNAAIARSAGESSDDLDQYGASVKATPYSGETVEVDFEGPGVDESMNLENNYRYGYKVSDKEITQEADKDGEVRGSYSYNMEDGTVVEVRYTAGKDGFRVENLDELMATVHEPSANDLNEYGVAPQVAEVVVAKTVPAEPSNTDYSYDDYEPYVHVDIPAEPYVHQDMPYVHEEIPAEPYVHQEIPAEQFVEETPVIAAKIAPPPASPVSNYQSQSEKKTIGRRRVAVHKNQASSGDVESRAFSFESISDEHEFTENADEANERTGSYSYITPEGDRITVKYSAGKNGFVILNPEEVLPQPTL